MLSIFQKKNLIKLNNNCYFEYIIILLYILFSVIGWYYSYSIAGIGIILLTILFCFVYNDSKYFIPATLCLIFSYNGGYSSSSFPIEIASYGILLIILILLYTLFNFKLSNFKKPKSYIGIMLLAISCIVPIFWNNIITEETKLMYFIYFSWVLYVLVYFVFGINFGKNSLRMVIFTLSSVIILLFFESFISVLNSLKEHPEENFLLFPYSVGWGICNEVGILLCFCMPFVFYEIIKTKNPIISAVSIVKIVMCYAGIVFSTSRAAILFGSIEIFVLVILMMIFSKKKITNIVFMLLMGALAILFLHLYYGIQKFIDDAIANLNSAQIKDDERLIHYKDAFNFWNTNLLTRIFGSGIVSKIETRMSFGKKDIVYIVFHSTFFETLAMGGIVGILALLFHFFEKYKQLWKKELPFVLVMLVGYLAVDAYGMIDNTYGMYYYMIPLVILMAALDNDKNTDIFNNDYNLQNNMTR